MKIKIFLLFNIFLFGCSNKASFISKPNENSAYLDLIKDDTLYFHVNDLDFDAGDEIACKLIVKCHGESEVIFDLDTTLPKSRTLELVIPKYDLMKEMNRWQLSSNTDYINALLVVSKTESNAFSWLSGIRRKKHDRMRVLIKHHFPNIPPEITIEAKQTDYNTDIYLSEKHRSIKVVQEVAFKMNNSGGPIRRHSLGTLWEFGDGRGSVLENPTHYYQKPGIYDVSVRVTAMDGTQYTTKKEINVEISKAGVSE